LLGRVLWRFYPTTILHGATTQKAMNSTFTAVKMNEFYEG